nr:thioesterase family protein [Brevibacterium renqingii]
MLDHFGPSLKSPWTRLTAPELTQTLRDDVVAGCDVESGERTIPDLVRHRDAGIIALRKLTAELAATHGADAAATAAAVPTEPTPSEVASDRAESLPVYLTEVSEDWIDYNGHMSEAFYVLVFGFATDQVMDHLGLDADYRNSAKASLYTVESHIRYLDEVALGSQLSVVPSLVSAGEKKLHLAYEMYVDERLVATEEIMALHVDQSTDAVVAFPAAIAERIARTITHRPEWVGRAIG